MTGCGPKPPVDEPRGYGRKRGEADGQPRRAYDREGSFAHCRIFESGRSAAMLLTSLVEIRQ